MAVTRSKEGKTDGIEGREDVEEGRKSYHSMVMRRMGKGGRKKGRKEERKERY